MPYWLYNITGTVSVMTGDVCDINFYTVILVFSLLLLTAGVQINITSVIRALGEVLGPNEKQRAQFWNRISTDCVNNLYEKQGYGLLITKFDTICK